MTALNASTAKTLLVMARTLFPYDHLDDSYYAVVIDSINRSAGKERIELLESGAAELNKSGEAEFNELPEEKRVQLLKRIEGTPFFNDMHSTTVREVFNNPAIWPHFEYEGPSARSGGFLKRGFDRKYWSADE